MVSLEMSLPGFLACKDYFPLICLSQTHSTIKHYVQYFESMKVFL